MSYYFSRTIKTGIETAIVALTHALKVEGFGVLGRIDMDEKFKEKLGFDFRRYVILGVCNPLFAHKALLLEDKTGVLLPCSIIVQQTSAGTVEIASINPSAAMSVVDNLALTEIAMEAGRNLRSAVDLTVVSRN